MYKNIVKRFLDIFFSLLIILLLSPVLIVISIWLHYANKGAGVFFTQKRPGKDGLIFEIIKFKSMTDDRDETGKLLPDAKRLTKVGRFIRLTSLDELPQLFNVLKGDMSFIGPRPLTVKYMAYYTDEEKRRHLVRPGITGWAQVNGRKNISWDRKLAYDIEYVDHISFLFDMKVLLKTVREVFNKEDVGVESSGVSKFVDFREKQWTELGRQDLIDAAREESERIRKRVLAK